MKASETFHHPVYKHNCAQAIAAKYQRLFADPDVVAKMQANGGGRAEGGLCGALYAAMQAMPDKAEEIKTAFANQASGDVTCKALKQNGRVACTRCIDIADEVLASLLAE